MKATEWKCGLSIVPRYFSDFQALAAAGIEVLEIGMGIDSLYSYDWKTAAEYAKETGISIWSVHLPFAPPDKIGLSSLDETIQKNTMAQYRKGIDNAALAGAKYVVVHASSIVTPEEDRPQAMEIAGRSLSELAEYGEPKGIAVAVEDLPRGMGRTSDEILEMLSYDSRLRACFDANHLQHETDVNFIKKVRDRIATTHISDYDFLNERHWLPYEGKNDWVGIVTALEEVGYSGPFLYELGLQPPASIQRRKLTYGDFRANYEACVNKLPAEPIGTPIPEVCRQQALSVPHIDVVPAPED